MKDFVVVFESERINFVKVSQKLVDDYLKMVNDPEIAQQIGNTKKYTRQEEEAWVKSRLDDGLPCFSMIEKKTGDFIGNVEIHRVVNGIGEIGISITTAKQNQHYGAEAIPALLKYGREVLGVKGFDLNVFKTNARAIHCYEKAGFVKDGAGKAGYDIHMTYIGA